jgi:diguanylate cyclase (GGDEF)-like protein
MAVLDDQLKFVEVNRWIAQLHGLPAEAFAGKNVAEILPALAPAIQPVVERVLKTRETAQDEMNGQLLSPAEPGRHWLVCYVPMPNRPEVLMLAVENTERKRTEEALKRANAELMIKAAALHQMEILNEMCRLLRSSIADVEAYWIIEGYVQRLFPENPGALCLINPDKDVVEVVARWGEQPVCESVFNQDHCRALQNRRVHQVNDLRSREACRHLTGESGAAAICIPVQANLQTSGILHLRKKEGPFFEESQLVLANKVAEDIGLALANLKLQRAFRHQAQRDPLTGLYNRRYLEESLHRELRRSMRKGLSLGVMMVDIDDFKQFNNSEGHAGGDALLRRLGEWFASQVRVEDIVCRYGGDEFLLVLPDTSSQHLMKRAGELRHAIKKFNVHWQGKQFNVTVSIGIAAFPDHGSTYDELMKAADDALYTAKAGGRDRVDDPAANRPKDGQRIFQLFSSHRDLLSCNQAGSVLARLAEFASCICTQGYSAAVENLLPEHHRVGSPAEVVTELAASMTPKMPGREGDLLRKALEETLLEAAGLGYELHSLEIDRGLQSFLVRRGGFAFIELFLSLYVFDVVALRMQDSIDLAASSDASITMSMLALERRCRNVIRSVGKDLGLKTRVAELRGNKRLGATIMRAVEERFTTEEASAGSERPVEDSRPPENAVPSRYSAKRINRIS